MGLRQRNPRRQGDLGEAAAIHWLTGIGAAVSFPLFHSPDYDLVADLNGRLFRVQVKTSTQAQGDGYVVQIATSGGNQSWTGIVRRFDLSRCDFLFVLVEDGRQWFIPSEVVESGTNIKLGGRKYKEFEVGQGGQVKPSRIADPAPGERRSGRAGPDCKSGALAAEWVRIPPPPSASPSTSRSGAAGSTRISANRQITIPKRVFEATSLVVGDRFRVEAVGTGRIAVVRASELVDDYRRQLHGKN